MKGRPRDLERLVALRVSALLSPFASGRKDWGPGTSRRRWACHYAPSHPSQGRAWFGAPLRASSSAGNLLPSGEYRDTDVCAINVEEGLLLLHYGENLCSDASRANSHSLILRLISPAGAPDFFDSHSLGSWNDYEPTCPATSAWRHWSSSGKQTPRMVARRGNASFRPAMPRG